MKENIIIDVEDIKENILRRDIVLSKKIYNIIHNIGIISENEENKNDRILKTIEYFKNNKIVGNRGLNAKSQQFTLYELNNINAKNILNYEENEIKGMITEFHPKDLAHYILLKSKSEEKENTMLKYIRKINRYNREIGTELIENIKSKLENYIDISGNRELLNIISEYKYESIEDAIDHSFNYSREYNRITIRNDMEKIINILKFSKKDGEYNEVIEDAKIELEKHISNNFISQQLNKIEKEGIDNFKLNEIDILNYNKDPIEIYDFINENVVNFKAKGRKVLNAEIRKISDQIEDRYIAGVVLQLFDEKLENVNEIKLNLQKRKR